MLKRWWFALAGLGLLLSFQAFATKFIKVKVGNVRVMVPINEKPVATPAYSHEDDRLFSSKLITRSHPC